jgi:4-hydroxythreonine-4-phosphate dehydrogenase
MTNKIPLAITMGDPAGVGPELCWRVLTPDVLQKVLPVLIGSTSILLEAHKKFAPQLTFQTMTPEEFTALKDLESIQSYIIIIESYDLKVTDICYGQGSSKTGEAALAAISLATDLCLKNKVQGMVTAPVSKYHIESSGVKFRGHTEYISHQCGDFDEMMMMSSLRQNLHVGYTSTHVPVAWLTDIITEDLVYRRILQCQELIDELGLPNKKIGVCGLNPHAGEDGLLGEEDTKEVLPAVQRAREQGIDCDGPHPSDTLFVPSIRQRYGVILAMYHDQGGIPFKMLAFNDGVNHTLGLPIVRTSVDHGTAWDLAWQGTADIGSFHEAIEVALVRAKRRWNK